MLGDKLKCLLRFTPTRVGKTPAQAVEVLLLSRFTPTRVGKTWQAT